MSRPLSIFTAAAYRWIYCVLVIGLVPPGNFCLAVQSGIYGVSISQCWSYCLPLLYTTTRFRSRDVPWKRVVRSIPLPLKAGCTFSRCPGFISPRMFTDQGKYTEMHTASSSGPLCAVELSWEKRPAMKRLQAGCRFLKKDKEEL